MKYMKIWKLDCDVDYYENLFWEKDIDYTLSFDGVEKIKDWIPVQVQRMYHNRKFSNTPGLSPHLPVFDKKAVSVLDDLIKGNAEILPLDCKNKDFYLINVTNVIDCINYEKSEYKTFNDGIRIMRFIKYVFNERYINGVDLFKLKDEPLKRPFVSDKFRKRVLDSNLTGFIFELAWDSEQEQ